VPAYPDCPEKEAIKLVCLSNVVIGYESFGGVFIILSVVGLLCMSSGRDLNMNLSVLR